MLVLPHDMKTQPTWSENSLKNQTKGMWGIIPSAIQTARFRNFFGCNVGHTPGAAPARARRS